MGLPTSPDLRCPRCNAHVRHDADWCTLCYADLRPAPEPEPEPDPEPVVEEAVEAEPAPPVEVAAPAARTAGKHARRRAATGDPTALSGVDVDAMLAQLAAESDSGLGPLAGRLQSKGSKAIVISGGIAAVCLVLFLVMAVLGALL